MNYLEMAQDLLTSARKKGASGGDVVIVEGETSQVQVRMGEVDKLSSAKEKRLGLRLFFSPPSGGSAGLRTAVTSTADFSRSSLEDLVAATCAMAQSTGEDPCAGLPEPQGKRREKDLDLWDHDLKQLSMEKKIEMAKKAESEALAQDRRITNSEGGHLSVYSRQINYANSNGFSDEYASSTISLSVSPVAKDPTSDAPMQRDYWYSAKRKLASLDSPESIGREAARRTVRRLGARKITTRSCPVVFDPETAGELLGNLSAAVSGYSIYKGASYLCGKLGQPVASENVTVVDDGTIPSALGSRPFDGEGLPTRKTVVINKGILGTYLLDSYSARKLGLESTGNAARNIGDGPTVSPTNFYLSPGTHTPEEIIRSVKQGLYVIELIGFGINLVTGDYSRGAFGIWIENGELTYPVEGVTIAGNLKEMFSQIEMIGNDLEFRGTVAAPTLRVTQMTVAGD
jgi:PmbA protein